MTTPRPAPRVLAAVARGTVIIKLICVEVSLASIERVLADQPAAVAHLTKIRRWLMRCWETTGAPPQRLVDGAWCPAGKGKPLSSTVQRRALTETAAIDDARHAVIGDCRTLEAWAAWMVCLDALIHDVVCTWRPDGRRACWRYLGQTWETLARQFLSQCEDGGKAEEDGTEIYERVIESTGW